jgi:hypothetical protein
MPVYNLNMHNKTIVNCSYLDINGSYYSNGVSAIQIPADTSDNRPSTGLAGYIRYNTTTNLIEYWNNSTSTWSPVSEPSPSISTVSPQYILQDVSSNVYTITGANFNIFSSVSFIGSTDGITYPTASTTYVTSSQLTTLITDAIADASTNTYYAVRVTNTNTNFSVTTAYIVAYNKGPYWNTAIGSSLGIGVAGLTYTTGTSPFTDLSATDFNPQNIPVSYYYSSAPSTVTGSVLLDATLGRLYGTMPSFVGTSSTLYPFTAYPEDASGARGYTESFNFTVQSALLTVTGYTLNTNYTITYVDSSNNSSGSPTLTGYTIYSFTGTGITGTVTPNFDASINYLVVGGGGGGGSGNSGWFGAGGGAGGYRAGNFAFSKNVSYSIIVGAGGTFTASNNASGTNGALSRLGPTGVSGITSNGGGGGPGISSSSSNSGGSGSGGAYSGAGTTGSAGGSGNSGGFTPIEGFGGGGYNSGGQGSPGGSALEKGNETTSDGSLGAINNITGIDASYASGGWGNPVSGPAVNNGRGNGGNGGRITNGTGQYGTNGSSGVVIIRFPSLITYNPSFRGGSVTGFSPGQFTITYVNSGNSIVSAPISGGFTIYTFLATTTGTFVPNFTDSTVDFLVIGGGGAGGSGGSDQVGAGGGGAGGYRTSYSTSGGTPGTAESKLSLSTSTSYTVTVGAGGDGQNASQTTGNNGSNSVFSTITSVGGGGGGSTGGTGTSGATGGSGGGANPYAGSAGSGTTNQGYAGFKTTTTGIAGGGGGGGASSTGGNASGTGTAAIGGAGGTGISSTITGLSVARGGGGGGGAYSTTTTQLGGTASSGGGNGASSSTGANTPGSPGTQNTGGGGGGAAGGGSSASQVNKGGSGGSGIVVIRFSSF